MQSTPTYESAPRIVVWEATRACALACRHCRADAIPHRNPQELSTNEAFALVDAIADCGRPLFIITGGDPMMRDDIFKILEYAANRDLPAAVSPSATGRLTERSLQQLVRAGCRRISLSIDGPGAQSHDAFRGVRGAFDRTLRAVRQAQANGLDVQVNTTLSKFNAQSLGEFATLLRSLDVSGWSVFALIPIGRAQTEDALCASELERALHELFALAQGLPFPVKTTEAPQYRRIALQAEARVGHPVLGLQRLLPIGDGRGFVFVSHTGEVSPSGFLPYIAGNVRERPLLDLYCEDRIMKRLREPDRFDGKCGVCEFRKICGGSRSRAFAASGSPFASDPGCPYIPAGVAI